MAQAAALVPVLLTLLPVAGCREPASPEPSPLAFREVSRDAGIDYRGSSYGASWGDFNGDGRPDLWVGHHQARASLYLNGGDGTFRDVIDEVWSGAASDTHGAVWADVDNDGDQDLIETVGGLRNRMSREQEAHFSNRLYVNEGGLLVDRAGELGVAHPYGRGRHGLWADWTGDGRLDLVLVNDVAAPGAASVLFFESAGAGGWRPIASPAAGPLRGLALFATLADLHGDEAPEIVVHGIGFPQAAFSLREGGLEEVTPNVGIAPVTLTFDAAFGDFDGDGRGDVFAARRRLPGSEVRLGPSRVVRAQLREPARREAGFSFVTSGEIAVRLGPSWNLGVTPERIFVGGTGGHPDGPELTLDPGDEANHGIAPHRPGIDAGVFVGFDPEESRWRILHSKAERWVLDTVTVVVESTEPVSSLETSGIQVHSPARSRLLLRRAEGFSDATSASGLDTPTECESVVAADFDNDMDLDLYLACSRRLENLPNRLFANQGDGRFVEVPGAGGAGGSEEGRADTVTVADYDGDGSVDLFVTNGGGTAPFNSGPEQLFRNLGGPNHWLEIDLEGISANRDGVGTRLVLITPDGRRQTRIVGGELHRIAQGHRRAHFGLGPHRRAERLEVHWPGGGVQTLAAIAADQVLTVRQEEIPRDGE